MGLSVLRRCAWVMSSEEGRISLERACLGPGQGSLPPPATQCLEWEEYDLEGLPKCQKQ